MNKNNFSIPVVMYHSVGIVNSNWHWNYLTCPLKRFESQIKWLKIAGYNTIVYQDIYDYINNKKELPKKSIFLTFDDGYLDNYVFAYPILKKYNMKGTIFVNPDFVEKKNIVRKTYEDENFSKPETLESDGFCSWQELKLMDKEGVLDVQSHAKTHTWYPVSEEIIDFRYPNDHYIWMDWNEFEEEKPYLQISPSRLSELGKAIFKNEKSMSSKRIFINNDFQVLLNKYVLDNGGLDFYKQKDWKEKLYKYSDNLKGEIKVVNKEESDQEYYDRIKFELEYTKNEISVQLEKDINFLCWPGGSATKKGVEISNEIGYLMSTAARDLTANQRKNIKNKPNQTQQRISRFTPVLFFRENKNKTYDIIYSNGLFFLIQIKSFTTAGIYKIMNSLFSKLVDKYMTYAKR